MLVTVALLLSSASPCFALVLSPSNSNGVAEGDPKAETHQWEELVSGGGSGDASPAALANVDPKTLEALTDALKIVEETATGSVDTLKSLVGQKKKVTATEIDDPATFAFKSAKRIAEDAGQRFNIGVPPKITETAQNLKAWAEAGSELAGEATRKSADAFSMTANGLANILEGKKPNKWKMPEYTPPPKPVRKKAKPQKKEKPKGSLGMKMYEESLANAGNTIDWLFPAKSPEEKIQKGRIKADVQAAVQGSLIGGGLGALIAKVVPNHNMAAGFQEGLGNGFTLAGLLSDLNQIADMKEPSGKDSGISSALKSMGYKQIYKRFIYPTLKFTPFVKTAKKSHYLDELLRIVTRKPKINSAKALAQWVVAEAKGGLAEVGEN